MVRTERAFRKSSSYATSHPPNTVNIASGQVADNTVNAQDAVAIGTKTMQEFEKGWPEGFRNTIPKKVKTVSDSKRHIKVGSQKIYNTSVIYSRVMGIHASSRDKLPCTLFCKCNASSDCLSELTNTVSTPQEDSV